MSEEMIECRREWLDNLLYQNRILKEKLDSINSLSNTYDIYTEYLDTNYNYYRENCGKLYEMYKKKYLLIHDCKVIDEYDNYADAVKYGERNYGFGNFIVQENVKELQPLYINNDNAAFNFTQYPYASVEINKLAQTMLNKLSNINNIDKVPNITC